MTRNNYTFFGLGLSLALAISVIPPKLVAQSVSTNTASKIDALVKSYAEIKQFNGNVLVAQKGKVIFARSYGLADFELNVPNHRSTKFRIGSITKQFTAVLVMQLYDEGLINLDSSISTYLKWYPHKTGRKITIRHLLSHSSGLSNYTEREDFYNRLAFETVTPQQFGSQYCTDTTLLFEPGSQFRYCNTDYYVLGLIIEAITQKSFHEVLNKRILRQSGMTNTGIDSLTSILPKRAKGYEYRFMGYENADPINMSTSTFAAGAMYSTVDDLLRWQVSLLAGGLLKPESKKLFFTPVINNHAFGLYINKMKNGKTAIGHPGGINGFSSFLVHYPEDSITIILLDNTASGKRGNLDNTSFDIYSILVGEPYEHPKIPLVMRLSETYLKKGVIKMLQQYQEHKTDTSYDLARLNNYLNNFGYKLLTKGKVKESVVVLKVAVEEQPNNTNVLDSYAEALKADGQLQLAIACYQKILQLQPGDQRIRQVMESLQTHSMEK